MVQLRLVDVALGSVADVLWTGRQGDALTVHRASNILVDRLYMAEIGGSAVSVNASTSVKITQVCAETWEPSIHIKGTSARAQAGALRPLPV